MPELTPIQSKSTDVTSDATPADTRWWSGKVGNFGSQRVPLEDERRPVVFPKI